jgi:photosystem II stability/assembly factor-like uncharacterized protein
MKRFRRGMRLAAAVFAAALGLTTIALATPAVSLAAYAPWVAQKSGTTQPLRGVSFATASVGWAVGGGGIVLHTVNGGGAWSLQKAGTTQTLNGVAFVNEDLGWAVGGGGVILRTTNGGANWSVQKSGTTQTLYGVAFADASNGWAVGGGGVILHTTNGGGAWAAQTSTTTQPLNAVACADASTCWAVGNRNTVRHTTDGGKTWSTQATGLKKNTALRAVTSGSASVAWIAADRGALRKTTNGGASWTAQTSGTGQTLYGSFAADASHVRVVGGNGTVRATSNGGGAWAAEGTPMIQALYEVACVGTHAWAVGAAGTIITYSPDLKPPVTTATGLQADDHSGWTNAAQTVKLGATDAGRAGVAATYYTLDGGGRVTYSAPFTVSGQRVHTVTYWSVDQAGNVEDVLTGYVNIDATPPTVGASGFDAAWHNTDVQVTLTAGDAVSGVASVAYREGTSGAWTTIAGASATVTVSATGNDGTHTYQYQATDAAGNVSGAGSFAVKIDATAPTTTPTGLGADALSDWGTTTRTVSLAADDGPGSGVASTHYTVDGGIAKAYSGSPFTVSGAGQHQVTYWSVDAIGNVEAVRTGWVNIADFYAQSHGLAPDQTSGWYNGPATITITAGGIPTDLSVCYQLDGGATQTIAGETSFPVSGEGHHTVVFWAVQGSLESAHQTGYVNIDLVKPVTVLATPVPTRWVNHDVIVKYDAQDVLSNGVFSGIASTFSRVNGQTAVEGAELPLLAPLTHLGDGKFVVQYWSVDNAGNAEAAKSCTVKIDTRKPTTKAPYSLAVRRGQTAKLRYVVADRAPCAGTAAAKIVIKNAKGKPVKTIKVKKVKTGVTATVKFRCKLAKGKYRFFVYGTDAAGNAQSRIASNRLTVR